MALWRITLMRRFLQFEHPSRDFRCVFRAGNRALLRVVMGACGMISLSLQRAAREIGCS